MSSAHASATHRRDRVRVAEPAVRQAAFSDISQARNRLFDVVRSVMVRFPLSQELERTSYQRHAGTSASRIQPCSVRAPEDARPAAMRFQRQSTTRHRRRPAGIDVRISMHASPSLAVSRHLVSTEVIRPARSISQERETSSATARLLPASLADSFSRPAHLIVDSGLPGWLRRPLQPHDRSCPR